MASPISFGDAILMGKLAWRLGQAFTTGRKSAPSEFREIESQLYSLSKALEWLGNAKIHVDTVANPIGPVATAAPPVDGQSTIDPMLRSCRDCLKHLEETVDRYSCVTEQPDLQKPRLTQWSKHLKINWRKIHWTTEGGNLETLRSQLIVHTNALNLVLGVATHTHVRRVEADVEQTTIMLKEIHEWFVETLKPGTPSSQQPATPTASQETDITPLREVTFELYLNTDVAQSPILICNHASLSSSLTIKTSDDIQTKAFECRCAPTSHEHYRGTHAAAIAAYAISRGTFPVRVAGKERSWLIYRATDTDTNRVVSLTIKGVSLHGMEVFERLFIRRLADVQAALMFQRGESNMLAYLDPDKQEYRRLYLVANIHSVKPSLQSVAFSSGLRSYTRTSIEEIQLLHYKQFQGFASPTNDLALRRISDSPFLPNAELVLFFGDKDNAAAGDISQVTLNLTRSKKPVLNMDDASVVLKSIECTGLMQDDSARQARSVDAKFCFASGEAAETFHWKIEDMRTELFVMGLQYRRPEEDLVLTIQASQVRSRDVDIRDADITIVQNPQTSAYRMIIISRNGASVLSQELPADFLSSLTRPDGPNLESTAYVAQLDRNGMRELSKYPKGFERLEFSHGSNDRLFELGLATIAGSLPYRPPAEPQAQGS